MNNTPLEHEEQEAVVEYLELLKIKFTSIPNSTYTKSWKQKAFNKKQGLRAGLPDLLCLIKDKLVFIEMKRQKGSVVSDVQKSWIEELNKVDNVYAHVCKGFDEAKEIIDKYNKTQKKICLFHGKHTHQICPACKKCKHDNTMTGELGDWCKDCGLFSIKK